jgi:FAD/FMN-containing dehydrogenase
LGGGLGWLHGLYGLACDNLLSADVVTADGRLLTASNNENPDLFWGLRGGGGNFGIATSFEYRLHPVGSVLAGFLFYPIAKGTEVFHFYREYLPQLPEACRVDIGILTARMATWWLVFFLATSGRWSKASVWSSHCAA